MGFLDGIIGGAIGAEMATTVNRLIEQHGGIQGVIGQLQQSGLGNTVRSWTQPGPNQPVSGPEVHQALGEQTVNELAAKAGIPPEEMARKLAEILPTVVNAHANPNSDEESTPQSSSGMGTSSGSGI